MNGYLTKPTTRLGRYNLLLKEILKHTPEGHPDRATIPRAMEIVRGFLTEVNVETGRIENQFTLEQIDSRLSFKSGTEVVVRWGYIVLTTCARSSIEVFYNDYNQILECSLFS